MIIKILTNTVELDGSTYLSRTKNFAMSTTTSGVSLVNGDQVIDIPYATTTVDGVQATSSVHLAELLLPAFNWGSGSGPSPGEGVQSVTGDLVNNADPDNPVVDLPDWVNQIKNGRFTNLRVLTGTSNLLPSDAGCLIISSYDPDEPQENELIFTDEALQNLERFVILNEYPIKLTNSNDATVIVPDGYLPEAVGNGQVVWVVKTDTGTYYAFGDGLKHDDVNDKMVMTIATDGSAKPTPLAIKHLTNIGGFPAFANGVHVATAMNSGTQTGLLSFVKFNNNVAEAGTFPMYGTGGVLKVGNGVADDDSVNLGQLKSIGGTTVLKPVSGTSTTIPSGIKGKLIIVTNGNSVINVNSDVSSLISHTGLEITFINKSSTSDVVFNSFSGQNQMLADAGSSASTSITIPAGSSQYLICDGDNFIST